ncbi:Scr1 family TA system antitoxin-like transcriptional regulator [Sphaerisporangium sp. NPDC004334]
MADNADPRTSPVTGFGRELATRRKARGWSQRRLAERIGCSPSLVGHIEAGSRNPQLDFAEACDRVFEPPGGDHFVRLHRRIHHAPSGPEWFLRWLEEIEPGATVLRVWAPFLIPGLLQTEDYARAVFLGHFSTPEAQVEEQVAARIRRQEALDPKQSAAIASTYRRVGTEASDWQPGSYERSAQTPSGGGGSPPCHGTTRSL